MEREKLPPLKQDLKLKIEQKHNFKDEDVDINQLICDLENESPLPKR